MTPGFWRDKRVILTGHTGFKGAWASVLLETLGAQVTGLSLPPEGHPNLWTLVAPGSRGISSYVDIRDADAVARVIDDCTPQVVVHMAAQALVFQSYREPLETFAVNVDGTLNLLEALRGQEDIEAILVVTSDKVYRNTESRRSFKEDDPLGGDDPYSASKAACEIVVSSYAKSYFAPSGTPVVTARAGNVIGGGDWAADRLVPDTYRAALAHEPLVLRHPDATRPWHHVLDSLNGYLTYVEALLREPFGSLPTALNFGPSDTHMPTVGELAEQLNRALDNPQPWKQMLGGTPAEKKVLALDSSLARKVLGQTPLLDVDEAVDWTVDWYSRFTRGEDGRALTEEQINRYVAQCS
jgi:CDP-glucose 4,6-dehydratase